MILNTFEVKEDRNFKGNSSEMTIDVSDMAVMMHLLSSGLYSNPIGSIVREYCSNAWDSHIEANIDKPILVSIKKDNLGEYFSVQDFGVGLSPERVDKVFNKYLASTKRNTQSQLGAFGLGSKSALAYTDCFYITTIYDGVEYAFAMHKGNGGLTKLEALYTTPSNDGNGTTIKIYIKDNWSDKRRFIEECKRQLLYFENVSFDIENFNLGIIFKGENFNYCSDLPHANMHIILGSVAYPIDFEQLGIGRINCPIGLKLDIGSVPVTPSRESIQYDENTKEFILDRIREVSDEVFYIYNNSIKEFKTIADFNSKFDKYRNYIYLDSRFKLDITDLKQHISSDFEIKFPKIKCFGDLDCTNFVFNRLVDTFKVDFYIDDETQRVNKNTPRNKYKRFNHLIDFENVNLVNITNTKLNHKKNKFISSTIGEDVYLFSHSSKKLTRFDIENILGSFNLKRCDLDNKEIDRVVKLWLKVQRDFINQFPLYNDYKITKEWEMEQKALRTANSKHKVREIGVIKVGDIVSRKGKLKVIYENYPIETVKSHSDTIYGTKDEIDLMMDIYHSGLLKHFTFSIVAPSYLKYYKDNPKAHTCEEFINIPHDLYIKYVNRDKLSDIDYNTKYLSLVNELVDEDLNAIHNEIRNYISNYEGLKRFHTVAEKIVTEKELIRQDLIDKATKLSETLSKFGFLKYFNVYEDGVIDVIKSYIEYNKLNNN